VAKLRAVNHSSSSTTRDTRDTYVTQADGSLREAVETLEQELARSRAATHQLQSKLESNEQELDAQSMELAEKAREIQLIRSAFHKLQQEATARQRAIPLQAHAASLTSSDQIADLEAGKLRRREAVIASLIGERDCLRSLVQQSTSQNRQERELERRLEIAQAQLQFHKEELSKFRNHVESEKIAIAKKCRQEAAQKWQAQLDGKRRETAFLESKLEDSRRAQSQLAQERDTTQAAIATLLAGEAGRKQQLERILAREQRTLQEQQQSLREQRQALAVSAKQAEHACEARIAQAQAEAAAQISEEKRTLDAFKLSLASELERMKSLHPLSDCLRFTEREILRIDGDLKALHPLRLERPQLEAARAKLEEQRQFLADLIDTTAAKFDAEARKLRSN
jgi:hypothetical protein